MICDQYCGCHHDGLTSRIAIVGRKCVPFPHGVISEITNRLSIRMSTSASAVNLGGGRAGGVIKVENNLDGWGAHAKEELSWCSLCM